MLTLYHSRAGRGERPANLAEESLPENVAWIDLLKPQPDEVAFVKRTTGLDVPSIAGLSEIESSSRLRSTPTIRSDSTAGQRSTLRCHRGSGVRSTLRWSEPDSNRRSRSCKGLCCWPAIQDAGTKTETS
jgi:hypothetical protein